MKVLRSDKGTEYKSNVIQQYLAKYGIEFQETGGYAPEQNGKVERQNRTIVEGVRTMLIAREVPKFLWAEAVNTEMYIQNRVLGPVGSESTSYEIWMGRKPTVKHLRVFGTQAIVHIPGSKRKKLDGKADEGILVGYQGDLANYRVYVPTGSKVIESHDVIFPRVAERGGDDQADDKVFVEIDGPLEPELEIDQGDNADPVVEGSPNAVEVGARHMEEPESQGGSNDDKAGQVETKQLEVEKNLNLLEELSSICDDLNESNADELSEEFLDAIQSPQVKRSNREKKPPSWHNDYVVNVAAVKGNEPKNFQDAITGPNADR